MKNQIAIGDVVRTKTQAYVVKSISETTVEGEMVMALGGLYGSNKWKVKHTGYTSNIAKTAIKDVLKNQSVHHDAYGF